MAFIIIGKDEPIYELDMSNKREDIARQNQFTIHAALDMVDAAVLSTPPTGGPCYLKVVDSLNDARVSAYVTPGCARFMVLHMAADRRDEEVRSFCAEVHELYVKVLLNPFYAPHTRIESRDFDARVRALARKYLGFKE